MSRTGLAEELRAAGYNVRSVREIFGREAIGLPDPEINSGAEQIDSRVLTHDKGEKLGTGFGQRAIRLDDRASSTPSILRLLKSELGDAP